MPETPFPAGTDPGFVNAKRRLWVAAVDTTIGAIDPSHPAFFLEGQEDTPNMRGFWANATCTATAPAGAPPSACTAGYECCSGFCINKVCVDPSTVACAGIGDSPHAPKHERPKRPNVPRRASHVPLTGPRGANGNARNCRNMGRAGEGARH